MPCEPMVRGQTLQSHPRKPRRDWYAWSGGPMRHMLGMVALFWGSSTSKPSDALSGGMIFRSSERRQQTTGRHVSPAWCRTVGRGAGCQCTLPVLSWCSRCFCRTATGLAVQGRSRGRQNGLPSSTALAFPMHTEPIMCRLLDQRSTVLRLIDKACAEASR